MEGISENLSSRVGLCESRFASEIDAGKRLEAFENDRERARHLRRGFTALSGRFVERSKDSGTRRQF